MPKKPSTKKVPPLRRRTMTLEKLQQETLKVLRAVRKQFNRSPYEDGMSDGEFLDQVLEPFKNDILTDIYVLKMVKQRKGDE